MNKMEQEQLEVIEHINYQLKTSIFNQFESYEHTEYINGQEVVSEINREKHLEYIMKWCLQELENNFDYEEEK